MISDGLIYIDAIVTMVVVVICAQVVALSRIGGTVIETQRRVLTVDGLRGYLALSVFMSHYITTYYWKLTGVWGTDNQPMIGSGAAIGVDVFFMITSFLFIGRIIKPQSQDWMNLFISRMFRIYPAYMVAVSIMFGLALTSVGHSISLIRFGAAVVRWILFVGGSIGDADNPKLVIAGVHWTLRYELVFYLSLPILAFIFRNSRALTVLFCAAVFIISLYSIHVSKFSSVYLYNFLIGGLIAYARHRGLAPPRFLGRAAGSVLTIGLITLSFLCYGKPLIQETLLGIVFYRIVTGDDLLGLLHLRGSLMLGDVSYSIYLMHGIVLYLLFSCVFPTFIVDHPGYGFFILMPIVALTVMFVALSSFKLVEQPWIRIGRNLQALRSRSASASAVLVGSSST